MRRNRDYDNRQQSSNNGPLITDHLRDLDIELELLKRKRELVQQKQEMLNRYSMKRQYDYEYPPNTYDRQQPNNQWSNNFPNRYDCPDNSGNYVRPQAVKRQAPDHYWQAPVATKRFPAAQKIDPWVIQNPRPESGFPIRKNFPSQPVNISGPIRPLMAIRPSIGQRINKKNTIPRKDFKPTRVTKPKPQQGPYKVSTHAVLEAKQLASKVHDPVDQEVETDQVLRVNKTPSVQVKGRLELALGTIMKEIKNDHCQTSEDSEHFQCPFIQRLLKHAIRTRIRSVMIDQVVGNMSDVVNKYRKRFPKETDNELVLIAKEAQSLSTKSVGVPQLIDTDDPQEFYHKNMMKALHMKLDEMFGNLQKLYQNKGKDLDEYIKDMPEPKTADDKDKKQSATGYTYRKKIRLDHDSIDEKKTIENINERLSKVKFYREFMDELIHQRLPKLLPKFKDAILSLLLTDKEFLSVRDMIIHQIKKKMKRVKYAAENDINLETKSTNIQTTTETCSTDSEKTSVDSAAEGTFSASTTTEADKSCDTEKRSTTAPIGSPTNAASETFQNTNATPGTIAKTTATIVTPESIAITSANTVTPKTIAKTTETTATPATFGKTVATTATPETIAKTSTTTGTPATITKTSETTATPETIAKTSATTAIPATITKTSSTPETIAKTSATTAAPATIANTSATPAAIANTSATNATPATIANTSSTIATSEATPKTSATTATPATIAKTSPTTATPATKTSATTANSDTIAKTSVAPDKISTEQIVPVAANSDDLFYVKLISRPNLPARAVIYDFLKQFKPASIKKHKSIGNLLVIGFTNKEDYDKILTVTESVVGNATIVIKASEQVSKTKSTPAQEGSDENMSKSADQSLLDDSLLGAELDSQITDLLTSIKNSNESDDSSGASNSCDKLNTQGIPEKTSGNENSATADIGKCFEIKTEQNIDTADIDDNIKTSKENVEKTTNKPVDTEPMEQDELQETTNTTNLKESVKSTEEVKKEIENMEVNEQKNKTAINNMPEKPSLRESGRATPTRSSSRLASSTPSTIKTRKGSRLTQN